jgi:hypothetical protein
LRGALLQQWHLWLVNPSPSVCEMVWRGVVLVLAAIWAMEQGRKRLWFLAHTPPRQGSAAQQAISKASTSFCSALHDFARHDRPFPAKGWGEIGPDHPLLSVRIQVPLRPCLEVMHRRGAFSVLCLSGVVLHWHMIDRYMVLLCLASICFLLCFALPCSFLHT